MFLMACRYCSDQAEVVLAHGRVTRMPKSVSTKAAPRATAMNTSRATKSSIFGSLSGHRVGRAVGTSRMVTVRTVSSAERSGRTYLPA
jgi:hypothetical protein